MAGPLKKLTFCGFPTLFKVLIFVWLALRFKSTVNVAGIMLHQGNRTFFQCHDTKENTFILRLHFHLDIFFGDLTKMPSPHFFCRLNFWPYYRISVSNFICTDALNYYDLFYLSEVNFVALRCSWTIFPCFQRFDVSGKSWFEIQINC